MVIRDLRGLLQYVPQFRGRCFVVRTGVELLRCESWLDLVLDLHALQNIGVKLVVAVSAGEGERVFGDLVLGDLRAARAGGEGEPSPGTVLERRQVAVVELDDELLGEPLENLAVEVEAKKVLVVTKGATARGRDKTEQTLRAEELPERLAAGVLAREDLFDRAAVLCRAGVRRVHFLNGLRRGVLLDELFSNEGVGTMVYSDAYQELVPLSEDDIPELLSLVGRSMVDSTLLARSYESILDRLGDYWVLKVDGNVVGSVALHCFEGNAWAEIACLYIKASHEGLGYGRRLVAHAERVAASAGCEGVFAISKSAVSYFRDRLKYLEMPRENLPEERLRALLNSGRESAVFGKHL